LLKKKDITEDNERQIQEDVQKITDRYIKQVDEALLSKESDLLEI
jgi:ribosome recycling factor